MIIIYSFEFKFDEVCRWKKLNIVVYSLPVDNQLERNSEMGSQLERDSEHSLSEFKKTLVIRWCECKARFRKSTTKVSKTHGI